MDCSRFKNGTFKIKYRDTKGDLNFTIIRKDSLQSEVVEETGDTTLLSIKWVNDCKYEVLLIKTTANYSDSAQNVRKTVPMEVEIIRSGKDYYVYRVHRGNSPAMTDTMWLAH